MADFHNAPESKNVTDLTGVTSEIRGRLEQLFKMLTWDQDRKQSYINPDQQKYMHSHAASPMTREEMYGLMFGPFALGFEKPNQNQYGTGENGTYRSPYANVFAKEQAKTVKKSEY